MISRYIYSMLVETRIKGKLEELLIHVTTDKETIFH